MISAEWRNAASIKEVARVQRAIAQKLINAAVKFVRAGLGDRIENATHGASVSGAERCGQHLKFTNSFDARERTTRACRKMAVIVIDITTVKQERVVFATHAGNAESPAEALVGVAP